jgi:GT2 family glycosyltransferase
LSFSDARPRLRPIIRIRAFLSLSSVFPHRICILDKMDRGPRWLPGGPAWRAVSALAAARLSGKERSMNPWTGTGVTLSIISPTLNRPDALRRCLVALRTTVRTRHEVVVVGSDESNRIEPWLRQFTDIKYIAEERREGLTAALNHGLREAAGRYVMWLHDDARPLAGAIDSAVSAMKRPDFSDVGMIALYHTNLLPKTQRLDSVVHEGATYSIGAIGPKVYSNFGVVRREAFEKIGVIDTRFYLRCWDIDLALRITDAGMRVGGLREARVAHEIAPDQRRILDQGVAERDLERLKLKWELDDSVGIPPAEAQVPIELLSARPASGLLASPAGMPAALHRMVS